MDKEIESGKHPYVVTVTRVHKGAIAPVGKSFLVVTFKQNRKIYTNKVLADSMAIKSHQDSVAAQLWSNMVTHFKIQL